MIVGRAHAAAGAPPARVWELLVDGQRRRDWDDAVAWAVFEGPVAPGSYVTTKPKRGRRQTAFRIDGADPPHRFVLGLTFGPLASLQQTWSIDAAPGGSSIACEIAIDGPLAGVLVRGMASRMLAALPENLARLARLAEA